MKARCLAVILVFPVLLVACKAELAEVERNQLLVGTWTSANDVRRYQFDSTGSFSMTFNPKGCTEGAPSEVTTASGAWKFDGSILALTVDKASDALLLDSAMRETIVSLKPPSLVLNSSVVVCGGQGPEEVHLRKQ